MKAAVSEVAPQPGFREFLRDQLAARCARNAQYSLRAFANYLGVNHSTLSQMLRGKRTLTREAIEKFGFRLGLVEGDVAAWVERERHRAAPEGGRREKLRELARDTAEVLEDWRNFAILELTRLKDFQPDSRWIARMLGITVDEVNIAVSRLCRLRLLRMMPGGRWQDQLGDAVMDMDHFSDAALRTLVEQVHQHRAASQHSAASLSAATFAVSSRHVPQAIERIASFREELLASLTSEGDKEEVYQLEIRFMPVTRRSPDS